MHAHLIVSHDNSAGIKKAEEIAASNNSKIINYTLLKIEDAKEIKKITKFSFSESTAIIINDIDSATNEALNAFLKNLEEPNTNLTYILIAKSIDSVLPTIVSRCEVIRINNSDLGDTKDGNGVVNSNNEATNFMKLDLNDKLSFISNIKDRDEAKKFIENIIKLEQHNGRFAYLNKALETLSNLNANGNVSLQLTAFVVTMNPAYGR